VFSFPSWAEDAGANTGVRDPTTPLDYSNVPASNAQALKLELHSVLISHQRKLAIINGNSVREGQQIPGAAGVKVQRILPQKVLVQQGDKIWAISLSPSVRH
jgi:MSHA biogenesis protein MshK